MTLTKQQPLGKRESKKKAFVMRFTEYMSQAVLLSQLLLVKEKEGAKLCGENRASSGFTGHWLQSRHRAKLELRGCRVPVREETWPRSRPASSMLCDLGPHYDLSVLSFCRCIYQWRLGKFIKVLLDNG